MRWNRKSHLAQGLSVEPQIHRSTLEGPMSEEIADGLDADTSLEQPHGKAMPQPVRGMTEQRQATAVDVALESCGDRRPGHRGEGRENRQEQLQTRGARPCIAQIAGEYAHNRRG